MRSEAVIVYCALPREENLERGKCVKKKSKKQHIS